MASIWEDVSLGTLSLLASQSWVLRGLIGAAIGAALFIAIPPLFGAGSRIAVGTKSTTSASKPEGTVVAQSPSINAPNQSGGSNTIIQGNNNTVIVGPVKLPFESAVAENLLSRIPPGKPVILQSVGGDDAIADQYQAFLQSRGVQIRERQNIGIMSPPPRAKLTITDSGQSVVVTIAPNAY